MTIWNVHTLSENDAWFIEKGQVDSISRSRFKLGDEVIVCDKRHVMLAKYYQGQCPTCNSLETISFSSLSSAPLKYKFVNGRLIPQGSKISFKRSVNCRTQKVTQNISALVFRKGVFNFYLSVILIILVSVVALMNYYNLVSNNELLESISEVNNIISLNTELLVSKFSGLYNIAVLRLQNILQLTLQLLLGV